MAASYLPAASSRFASARISRMLAWVFCRFSSASAFSLSIWTRFSYNSGMIRIHLNDSTRDQLRSLRRKALPPKVRDRIEMLDLADAGWSAPRIAAHIGRCGQTVRDALKDF